MPITIRWLASMSASAFHAAACIAAGKPLVDPKLSATLAGPVQDLVASLAAAGLSPASIEDLFVPLSADFENNRELVERVLRKANLAPSSDTSSSITAAAAALENAFQAAVPGVVDELEVRSGPLREQWEARGPGLMATIGRLTESAAIAEDARVVLVHPATGGGGRAHLASNTVTMETVLTNPLPELPEVVRLGWLLAQLHLDVPMYSEKVASSRLARMAALAMLPPALSAAEYVEVARDDEAAWRRALTCWDLPGGDASGLYEPLRLWWQTYQDSPPPLGVALAALQEMVGPG